MPHIPKSSPKLPWVKAAAKPSQQKSWGFDTNFYRTKRWRNLRSYHLMESPLCIHCHKNGKLVSATVVDHIIPRKERPDLELEETNLQSLCESCHNRKSGRSKRGRGGQNPQDQAPTNRCG